MNTKHIQISILSTLVEISRALESRRHVYDISTNVCLATYLTLGVSATTKKDFNELEVMYP